MLWNTERSWRRCSQCLNLWFDGGTPSICQAGGTHIIDGSDNFSLLKNSYTAPGQANWRHCSKCQSLWFAASGAVSACPAGGSHILTGSGNYTLSFTVGAGQTQWKWCNKCQGLWYGGGPVQGLCPKGGTHQTPSSGSYRLIPVVKTIRLHTKLLTLPAVSIPTMINNVREVFATAKVDVEWLTEQSLNLPNLISLHVGSCNLGSTPTAEQSQLFAFRDFVGSNDLAIYFVRETDPAFAGCSVHPTTRPGVSIARAAPEWSLAHEVGHVLGLTHVSDSNRLMTDSGTANITNSPPDLVQSEIGTILASPLTHPI